MSKKKPAWLERALDPSTPMLNNQTIRTAVEWHSDGKRKILFPTIRQQTGLDRKLIKYDRNEARDIAISKGDFIEVPSFEEGNRLSKSISSQIYQARKNPNRRQYRKSSIKKVTGGNLVIAKNYKGF
jgi:hypothetical protein